MRQRVISIKEEMRTTETKCGLCISSKCCTYTTQKIDSPRSKLDFDFLLWQISHENMRIYRDSDGWFLLIENTCTHLLSGGLCAIYENRPQVCREYSNDYCEYDAPAEDGFDLYFDGYSSLLLYCQKRFKNWDQWQRNR